MVFHAFPGAIPGGFIGVDVFFVISGFLISTIVFSNLERSGFSLRDFYSRRVRRIFPALIVVLIASLMFGWYALLGDEFSRLGKHVSGGAVFISNFVFLKESGYFDGAAETKPMLHLWSLAIEEQFYLFWPLLVAFVWKRRFNFLKLTVIVAVLSFAVNIFMVGRNPTAAFYSPLSRFWELMTGGVLAYVNLYAPELNRRYPNVQSACGFLLLILGFGCIDTGRAFPGWWALAPALGSFLIISAGSGSELNRRLLANRGMVWFGLISYPLYLWHWPLLSFARIVSGAEPSLELRLALVSFSILLAWLTYRFVERPFRSGIGGGRKAILAAGLMCGVCAVAALAYVQVLQPRNSYPALEAVSAIGDFEYLTNLNSEKEKRSGIYSIKSERQATTLLIGDSHIAQYAPRIGGLIKSRPEDFNSAIFVVSGGCPPFPGVYEDAKVHDKCGDIRAKGLDLIDEDRVKVVVIGGAWSSYLLDQTSTPKRNPADYDYYYLNGGKKDYFRGGHGANLALANFEVFLAALAKRKPVYLLLDNPVGDAFDPHNFLDRHVFAAAGGADFRVAAMELGQRQVRQHLIDIAKNAGVDVIDPSVSLCRDGMCGRLTGDDEPIYKDANHLSPSWIEKNADYIDETLSYKTK